MMLAITRDDTKIDVTAVMPDGTPLNGPRSIKVYLLEHRELFTRCLLTKLLEYAAGRELSVGDRKVVKTLVSAEPESGYRFRDMVEAAPTDNIRIARIHLVPGGVQRRAWRRSTQLSNQDAGAH